jgi:hypothetical protein
LQLIELYLILGDQRSCQRRMESWMRREEEERRRKRKRRQ